LFSRKDGKTAAEPFLHFYSTINNQRENEES